MNGRRAGERQPRRSGDPPRLGAVPAQPAHVAYVNSPHKPHRFRVVEPLRLSSPSRDNDELRLDPKAEAAAIAASQKAHGFDARSGAVTMAAQGLGLMRAMSTEAAKEKAARFRATNFVVTPSRAAPASSAVGNTAASTRAAAAATAGANEDDEDNDAAAAAGQAAKTDPREHKEPFSGFRCASLANAARKFDLSKAAADRASVLDALVTAHRVLDAQLPAAATTKSPVTPPRDRRARVSPPRTRTVRLADHHAQFTDAISDAVEAPPAVDTHGEHANRDAPTADEGPKPSEAAGAPSKPDQPVKAPAERPRSAGPDRRPLKHSVVALVDSNAATTNHQSSSTAGHHGGGGGGEPTLKPESDWGIGLPSQRTAAQFRLAFDSTPFGKSVTPTGTTRRSDRPVSALEDRRFAQRALDRARRWADGEVARGAARRPASASWKRQPAPPSPV